MWTEYYKTWVQRHISKGRGGRPSMGARGLMTRVEETKQHHTLHKWEGEEEDEGQAAETTSN